MVIDQVNQACGYVQDDELRPFDSPTCLLASYDDLRARDRALPEKVYFASFEDGNWLSRESTWFLLTTHHRTVMGSGVLCFASQAAADAFREHPDEKITDWAGFRTAKGEPDKILEVLVDDIHMSPELVEVDKGDLVLWKMTGDQLEHDLEITIKGYPEAGVVTVPADGTEVSFRILATRPGSGFPVVRSGGEVFLGRLRVSGAHTLDEEAM
jgi:hypothetical protein